MELLTLHHVIPPSPAVPNTIVLKKMMKRGGTDIYLPVPKRSEDHRQLSSCAAELLGKEQLLSWIQAEVIILPCPIAGGDVGFN